MTEDEKFVREHWGSTRGSGPWLYEGARKLELTLYTSPHSTKFSGATKDGADSLWAQAADFTRQRLEEVRQVEEEIDLIFQKRESCFHKPALRPIYERILAREQAALSELKQGMKN